MKFLRDKAHCKHQSYTKEDINTMLDKKIDATEVYAKGNYAVGEITLTTEKEQQLINAKAIEYPEGFNKDNTWVLNARYLNENNNWVTEFITPLTDSTTYMETIQYSLRDDCIVVNGRLDSMTVGTEVTIQLLLMKVE